MVVDWIALQVRVELQFFVGRIVTHLVHMVFSPRRTLYILRAHARMGNGAIHFSQWAQVLLQ
jgi:hypothetical protein